MSEPTKDEIETLARFAPPGTTREQLLTLWLVAIGLTLRPLAPPIGRTR